VHLVGTVKEHGNATFFMQGLQCFDEIGDYKFLRIFMLQAVSLLRVYQKFS
jgi:hypothetical protein